MITIENWGLISYSEAWERQTALFDELIDAKLNGKPYTNRIIFCQHPHVYTLGKHGKAANMLLNPTQLQTIHAELFQYEEEVIGMLDDRDVEIVITVQNKFADILLSKMEDI